MVYYGNDGKTYNLNNKLGSGGEGIVYEVQGSPNMVAKIFKERNRSRDLKVEALAKLPWPSEVREYLVLPEVALYEDSGLKILRGYVMEKVDCSSTLADVYSETHPLSIYKKSCVAENLCRAVIAIHSTGNVVIGDFNSKNILVDRTNGKMRIVGVDNMQMTVKKGGRTVEFPCVALDPILFMPEILNKFQQQNAKKLEEITGGTFTRYTDYYCLAYHIHMLLMAQKPYGAAMDKTDIDNSVPAPTTKSMACRGQYAYVNLPAGTSLPKIYPSFDIITPKLQSLFIRAFKDGSSDPTVRPTAEEFLSALEDYTAGLRFCRCDGFDHYLHKTYNKKHCEWCRVEREKQQERQVSNEDILWMTEDELLHLADIAPGLKCVLYFELGVRYAGVRDSGITIIPDKRKANKYLKKSISFAETSEDIYLVELAKSVLNSME